MRRLDPSVPPATCCSSTGCTWAKSLLRKGGLGGETMGFPPRRSSPEGSRRLPLWRYTTVLLLLGEQYSRAGRLSAFEIDVRLRRLAQGIRLVDLDLHRAFFHY